MRLKKTAFKTQNESLRFQAAKVELRLEYVVVFGAFFVVNNFINICFFESLAFRKVVMSNKIFIFDFQYSNTPK
ncbi:MAG: hypothetical protein EAZ57_04685 [Cytophagales bacterium]|nr:MAG: hypothetical protein EAZ67_01195 [Cytophagales bacterium]TAF61090.1 MAG: hypothetical protein EAZ57_04685 [Cytophagales bacterium]